MCDETPGRIAGDTVDLMKLIQSSLAASELQQIKMKLKISLKLLRPLVDADVRPDENK